MQQQKDERSIGELFGDLARDTGTLVRQEVALARTEITHTAARAGRDIGVLAIGGAVAYAGFLALVAAAIIGLAAAGLDWWLAALIVGVIIAGIGAVLVQRGLGALRQEHLVPRQTIETLKDDVEWAKEQVQ
ncbi:MAG TPA: phage holin family protein [Chloroflexota bacterium]|nr:phage holin family protein [Chloroflexota bacterium]